MTAEHGQRPPGARAPGADAPLLTIVVPAYQEEALLAQNVRRLVDTLRATEASFEVVVVNDGSRDRTGEIADALARELPELVVVHQANQGVGGAIRSGAQRARGARLLVWPADMPCSLADLRPFLAHLEGADVIVGCRSRRPGYTTLMQLGSWIYPRLVYALFDLRLRDVNWICMYRTRDLRELELTQRGIPMLTEILVKVRDRGGTFQEVDAEMQARDAGVASASRPSVMAKTLVGLGRLWLDWRRERPLAQSKRGEQRPG